MFFALIVILFILAMSACSKRVSKLTKEDIALLCKENFPTPLPTVVTEVKVRVEEKIDTLHNDYAVVSYVQTFCPPSDTPKVRVDSFFCKCQDKIIIKWKTQFVDSSSTYTKPDTVSKYLLEVCEKKGTKLQSQVDYFKGELDKYKSKYRAIIWTGVGALAFILLVAFVIGRISNVRKILKR